MSTGHLVLWFLALVLQNAAFTWVSRARNSGSYGYHALAAVFSNGIWFAVQFTFIKLVADPDAALANNIALGVLYVAGTVTGSVLMHFIASRYLEKGKRKVGS